MTVVADPVAVELGRRRLAPRGVGMGFVVLAVFAGLLWLPNGIAGRLLMAVGLLAAFACDGILARRAMADVAVTVEPPFEAVAFEDAGFLVEVRGPAQEYRIDLPGTSPLLSFFVRANEPSVVVLPAPPRGVHRHLGMTVVAPGILGLFEASRRVRFWFATPLSVGPAPLPHTFSLPDVRAVRFGNNETAPIGRDLFRGVRPYAQGDPRRMVHWKATAHHGRLMVREAEGTGVVVLRLVLALHLAGPAAEAALGRAAFLAREALRGGWQIELVTLERSFAPPPPPAVDSIFFLAVAPEPIGPVEPRSGRVTSVVELNRRLAAAMVGPLAVEREALVTRIVSTAGDRWL